MLTARGLRESRGLGEVGKQNSSPLSLSPLRSSALEVVGASSKDVERHECGCVCPIGRGLVEDVVTYMERDGRPRPAGFV